MSGLRPGDTSSEDLSHLDATETELVRALVKGDRCAARAAFRKLVEADHCSICTGSHGAHPFWCPLKHVVPASVLAPGVRPSDPPPTDLDRALAWLRTQDPSRVVDTRHPDVRSLAREFAAVDLREHSVVQLADDIITALDSHDTHRTKHIRQCANRIKKIAAG